MALKSKLLFVIVLYGFKCLSQDNTQNFKLYDELIYNGFKYYADSISKNNNRLFFVMVNIAEYDTTSNKLKIVLDYSWYNPIPMFPATHIKYLNDRIYLIRFGNHVNKDIIKQCNFQVITEKEINYLGEKGKIYSKINKHPTGNSQSFIFELNQNNGKRKWYEYPEKAPKEDRVEDFEYFEYLRNGLKYEEYLKKKLSEYGY